MSIAEATAQRSHDAETKVGAVLINNNTDAVMSTGHNGFIRGAPDKNLPKTRPEKYKYMVHAEENLIANCARHGISMDNCSLIITLSPCQKCLRLMWQAGITQVVCRDIYRDHCIDLEDLDIIEERTPEGYYKLTYRSRSDKPRKTRLQSFVDWCINIFR
jgi:dCMP deaminase